MLTVLVNNQVIEEEPGSGDIIYKTIIGYEDKLESGDTADITVSVKQFYLEVQVDIKDANGVTKTVKTKGWTVEDLVKMLMDGDE